MYDYIKGAIAELNPTYAVIDAGGVGFHIIISLQTFTQIEKLATAKLYTHYIVREDAQILYGFSERVERDIFRMLISVSGVGGNTARMILSTYTPSELRSIISTENAVLLKNVKGLGLKSAQKIIVELTDKIAVLDVSGSDKGREVAVSNNNGEEACEALIMLGFSKNIATKAVTNVLKEAEDASVEEIIRMALKRL